MKCSLCKYKNAVDEAIRHPNGITVHTVMSLGRKLKDNRHKVCEKHTSDFYSAALSEIGKKITSANLNYVSIEAIWHEPIWNPRGDRF